MRILIPAVSASQSPDGVTRYAANLARCLALIPEVDCIQLVIGPWQETAFQTLLESHGDRIQVLTASLRNSAAGRNLWYWRELSKIAAAWDADLVHCSYPVPIRSMHFRCPVVTTLHDLYPWDEPHNFGYPRVFLNRLVLRQCIKASDALVCVSEITQQRLASRDAPVHRKSSYIPNCVDPSGISTASAYALVQDPFLLVVAQHRRNKNLELTVEIFGRLHRQMPALKLLLVGNNGPETTSLHSALNDRGLIPHVHLLAGITEQEMQWCYRHAAALLATSRTEGFGLPVAEALLAGCPVVCSDIAAFRELGDRHCCFIPLSGDTAARFTDALLQLIPRSRHSPISLPHLSSAVLAQRYFHLYSGLLGTDTASVPATLTLHETKGGLL